MLQLSTTRMIRVLSEAVETGHVVSEEGAALIYVKDGADTKVRMSQGNAGELFAGVSVSRNAPPARVPYFVDTVVPANRTLVLPRTPIAGQILVKVAGVAVGIVGIAAADATEVQLSGATLNFFTGEQGKAVTVQFIYVPSVIEAQTIIGDMPIGGWSSSVQSEIGTIKNAEFGTNMFVGADDFSTSLYVKTAAGGMFTVADAATGIPNCIVKSAPSAANPFLVLQVNVA